MAKPRHHGPKSKTASAPLTLKSPSGNQYPRKKRLKYQKNKQHLILNPPQQNSSMINPVNALSIIRAFGQVDTFGVIFISPN